MNFTMLITLLVLWPGIMWPVGIIFETRIVPIGKKQAFALAPGDLMLPIMLYAVTNLQQPSKYPLFPLLGWCLLGAWGGFALSRILREAERDCYTDRGRNSPTKGLHDIVGYCVFPELYFIYGFPPLIDGVMKMGLRCLINKYWGMFAAAGTFYVACLLCDAATVKDPMAVGSVRHPGDWAPCWTQEGRKRIHLIWRRFVGVFVGGK